MCGSHGLRSEGPVRVRGDHARAVLRARAGRDAGRLAVGRARHPRRPRVDDLRARRCRPRDAAVAEGRRPRPCSPTRRAAATTCCSRTTPRTPRINHTRYAIRGFFDGRTKYARYYGVGGGKPSSGLWGKDPGHKLYDVDADFADQEHEWYDLARRSARAREPRARPRPPGRAASELRAPPRVRTGRVQELRLLRMYSLIV